MIFIFIASLKKMIQYKSANNNTHISIIGNHCVKFQPSEKNLKKNINPIPFITQAKSIHKICNLFSINSFSDQPYIIIITNVTEATASIHIENKAVQRVLSILSERILETTSELAQKKADNIPNIIPFMI